MKHLKRYGYFPERFSDKINLVEDLSTDLSDDNLDVYIDKTNHGFSLVARSTSDVQRFSNGWESDEAINKFIERLSDFGFKLGKDVFIVPGIISVIFSFELE